MQLKVLTPVLLAFLFVFGCTKEVNQNTAENEAIQIKAWLDTMANNNTKVETTTTGLYFVTQTVGTGATVKAGDTVTVEYTAMFLNGSVFDSSSNFVYIHKAAGQRMIQGWEEGIEILSKGGSAVFLIPSAKAYGVNGYLAIPPYTPLLFMINVIDIK